MLMFQVCFVCIPLKKIKKKKKVEKEIRNAVVGEEPELLPAERRQLRSSGRWGPDASLQASSGGVPARTRWEETQAHWRLYPCYRQRLGVLSVEPEEERISAVPNQSWRNTREEGKEP